MVQLVDEQAGQALIAGHDILEDEVFQVDVNARLSHCLEHRRKGLRAIPQQACLIAEH